MLGLSMGGKPRMQISKEVIRDIVEDGQRTKTFYYKKVHKARHQLHRAAKDFRALRKVLEDNRCSNPLDPWGDGFPFVLTGFEEETDRVLKAIRHLEAAERRLEHAIWPLAASVAKEDLSRPGPADTLDLEIATTLCEVADMAGKSIDIDELQSVIDRLTKTTRAPGALRQKLKRARTK